MVRIIVFLFVFFAGLSIFSQSDSASCLFRIDTLTQIRYCLLCEKMAEPLGGMEGLLDTITSNLVLKDQSTIEGKIYIAFIVDEDGEISGERTLRNPGYKDLYRQVIIIIKNYKWNAAECKGKKVPSLFILPINVCYR